MFLLPPPAGAQGQGPRLSRDLQARLAVADSRGDIIVDNLSKDAIERLAAKHGARVKRHFSRGAVLEADGKALRALSQDPEIPHISGNHIVVSTMSVTREATGADQVQQADSRAARFTGRGVGIAVIDSGIALHSSLLGSVVASVDFVNGGRRTSRLGVDPYGHGTHIASLMAADEPGKGGLRGMAPGAHLVSLRVLDENGRGTVADVIEAIDWAIEHRQRYDLRIINLSLGHAPQEKAADDPLCQAVERAVQAGLLVVASAGNLGKTDDGRMILGGIVSPGLSAASLTAGGANTRGTASLADDTVATWSSRGPTHPDGLIKPDVLAPGNRIIGAAVEDSTLWRSLVDRRAGGSGVRGRLELSGTSMSAAVLSGAAALLLEAAPSLTPAQVKTALQLTASPIAGAGLIEMGTGEINVPLAVFVARFGPDKALPTVLVAGTPVVPSGLAFSPSSQDVDGSTLVWGNTLVWG
ncbi:MAG: S8 family serine peptidase, partial [Acidobacteriota bacterium]|nr:S8 family serine peptidase [Acidobacteriota bacterium]